MTKHTPGKWKCHGRRPVSVANGTVTIHTDEPICAYSVTAEFRDKGLRTRVQIADAFVTVSREGEAAANARLIAAAPDLYEVVSALLDGTLPWKETQTKAKAALAKARGETE